MSISIRPVHPVFVGEVSDIDISQPLTSDQVAAVEAGMDRYAVLAFRDQPLTDEQQLEFSRNFGELEVTLAGQMAKPEDRRLGDRLELGDISNLTARNQIRERDDRSPHVRAGQSAVALGCLVPSHRRRLYAAARPRDPGRWRQH